MYKRQGLRRIHQQVFTDQNILFAREKAFEYYEAAIDVLEREGEICRDERTNKIIYKNPENYLKAVSYTHLDVYKRQPLY